MAESDALTQLFSVPPDEFVATRDRLSAELARAGQKAESRELKKLRRPSPTAWATNQVVRRARAAVEGFLSASDQLRARQDALLAGRGDQTSYQAGVEGLREATAAVAAAAREALATEKRGAERELVDGVVANLRIAAQSGERRQSLLEARLTADLQPADDALAGLGLAGAVFTPGVARPAAPARAPVPAKADEGAAHARENQERQDAEKARALAEARAAEAAARDVASRAEAAAREATARREEAKARIHDAERALADAREALREAEAAQRETAREQARADGEARAAARRRESLERG
jgi:hypothetical protein